MNYASIVIATFVSTLFLYILFFVIGLSGVSKNRKAQGLDSKPK